MPTLLLLQQGLRVVGRAGLIGFLGAAMAGPGQALAQTPTWQSAFSGRDGQPAGGTSQVRGTVADASGNILVAGSFTGQIAFGNTLLTSAGGTDAFVAKYNPTTETWAWAVRGGGTGADGANGVAVSGNNVYLAGVFASNTAATVAGTALTGACGTDGFLAKYTDNGSSAANGWAVSGGGPGADVAYGVAASGSRIYLSGTYAAAAPARFAGVALTSAGTTDVFLAKYADTGAAASDGWAVSGGGTGDDQGYAVAAQDSSVYITGYFSASGSARFAGVAVTGPGLRDVFVAKYVDRTNRAGNGWVATGGARAYDQGQGLALNGTNVYVTGAMQSAAFSNPVNFAGVTLTNGNGQEDAFVAKLVDNGTSFGPGWVTLGGSATADSGYGVAVRGTDVYMTGSFNSTASLGGSATAVVAGVTLRGAGGQDVFVAKYTDNGPTVTANWASAGGGGTGPGAGIPAASNDYGYGLAVSGNRVYAGIAEGTAAGRYGSPYGTPAPYNAALLVPLDAGTGAWQRPEWPLQGTESRTLGTAADAAGQVFVTGTFTGTVAFGKYQLASVGLNDFFVAKWNPRANTWAWATSGGGLGDDVANGVAVANGSVYVTGSFRSGNYRQISIGDSLYTGRGGQEIFLTKFIDNGPAFARAWTVTGSSTADDEASAVAVNGSSVYVAGYIGTGNRGRELAGANPPSAGGFDAFLAKYTDNGATVGNGWATTGGGTSDDIALALAVNGPTLYTTGYFISNTNVRLAGTALTGAGTREMFLARYTDAGSTATPGGAVSGGGSGFDYGQGLAVSGANVYVTGYFGGTAQVAGTALTSAGSYDMFLAKYRDTGTALANGWALSGGGANSDSGRALAANGSAIYVAGTTTDAATVAGTALAGSSVDAFVARYTDLGSTARPDWALGAGGPSVDAAQALSVRADTVYVAGYARPPASFGPVPLASTSGSSTTNFLAVLRDAAPLLGTAPGPAGPAWQVGPNPARGVCTVIVPAAPGRGSRPATFRLLNPLGQVVRTQTVALPAAGGAVPLAVAGLPPGLYTVQLTTDAGRSTRRLVLE